MLSTFFSPPTPSSSSSSTPRTSSSPPSALHSALHSHHRSSSAPTHSLYSFPHYSSFPTDLTGLVLDFVIPPSHLCKRRKSSSYELDFDQDDPASHSGTNPVMFSTAAATSLPSIGAGVAGALPPSSSSTADGSRRRRKRKNFVDVYWQIPEDLDTAKATSHSRRSTGKLFFYDFILFLVGLSFVIRRCFRPVTSVSLARLTFREVESARTPLMLTGRFQRSKPQSSLSG